MFSAISERKMLSVRSVLLIGWLILIASLFWDPFSIVLTKPGNTASPFRIVGEFVKVQNQELISSPYPMGARIFWTMLVPIVPLFLMVFGHEAWRRVCPLSLASQIPGYLGLRRHRSGLHRRSGLVRRSLALIDRQSWLARNSWYIQFGMLFAGVSLRLLIINSDRTAMAIALLTVIGAAMLTGVLWGGKTWCNYFCPANIVQRIYTEPGGLLESAPHFTRPAVPQSMCRKPSATGSISACVGCTVDCGDIDLQRSYWNGISDPTRRNVYYMFVGLIIGFYGYYYLYAGNWDYYFSGIWTHESNVRDKLLSPGYFIDGHLLPVPKIVAAPLTLAIACAATLIIGRWMEAMYRRFRLRKGPLSEKVIIHHCLCVTTWVAINVFYSFGGRPNLNLLPMLDMRVVDIAIFGLTTWWLRRALEHTPNRYQEESMASSLLSELRKLKVNVGKLLDGRRLEDLKANEIYLLSKALPGFSHQQKLDAYRKILDEAVTEGATTSATALNQLENFRMQMNITEEEHTKLIEELGPSSIRDTDLSSVTPEEKRASFNHYRDILAGTVADRLGSGFAISDILEDPALKSTIEVLRHSFQISDQDHEAAIEELTSEPGLVRTKMDEALDALFRHQSLRSCLEAAEISGSLGKTLLGLLLDALDVHGHEIRLRALSILRNFGPGPLLQRYAEDLASLCGHELDLLLRQRIPSMPSMRWREVLHPDVLRILSQEASVRIDGDAAAAGRRGDKAAVLASSDIEGNLTELLAFKDPLIRAIGLVVCGYIRPNMAREAAQQMLAAETLSDHPILRSTAEGVAGIAPGDEQPAHGITLLMNVKLAGQPDLAFTIDKEYVTVGRAVDNDIAIPDPAVRPYHLAIRSDEGGVRLLRLDSGAVFVNGREPEEESVALGRSSVIALDNPGTTAPTITIDWDEPAGARGTVHVRPILRLAVLAQNDRLGHLSLARLADIAEGARIGRYREGSKLSSLITEGNCLLIYEGQIGLSNPLGPNLAPHAPFGPGDIISSDLLEVASPAFPEVTSDFATIMYFPETEEVSAATSFGNSHPFDPANEHRSTADDFSRPFRSGEQARVEAAI
jgi:hypothetical protein